MATTRGSFTLRVKEVQKGYSSLSSIALREMRSPPKKFGSSQEAGSSLSRQILRISRTMQMRR